MEIKSSSFFVAVEEPKSKPKRKMPPKLYRSFTEALREKYCANVQDVTKTQNCVIVFSGRPKSADKEKGELSYLRNVVLSDSRINSNGLSSCDLRSLCPNLIDLDLAGNLLESWEQVLPIITQLPNLKFLNLARNKLKNNQGFLQSWEQTLPGVENLVLNMTSIKWLDALCLARLMPDLKELHICLNGYSKLPDCDHAGLESVECLRMNDNKIQSWDEVWKLRHLPNLKSLILSGNPLADVFFHEESLDSSAVCSCLDNMQQRDENGNREAKHEGDVDSVRFNTESQVDDNGNGGERCDNDDEDDKAIVDWCRCILEGVIRDMDAPGQMGTSAQAGWRDPAPCDNAGDLLGPEPVMQNRPSESGTSLNDNSTLQAESDISKGENSGTDELEKGGKSVSCQCKCRGADAEEGEKRKPFCLLQNLCLSETALSKWKHLSALSSFPSLKSLRMKDVKLASKLSQDERRKLFLASLPNIKSLNGSEVSHTEREKSERHFLRYFMDKRLKPPCYQQLEQKHGQLPPLVDIDIGAGFQEWATLTFLLNGKEVFTDTIRVVDPVSQLRQHVSKKLKLRSYIKLYHRNCGPHHPDTQEPELEELYLDSLPMSRFDVRDGDEIHIEESRGGNQRVSWVSKSNKVSQR